MSNIYADNEFDSDDISLAMRPSTMHICAANEHVPKIERCIRTIKERCRTICHTLPYKVHTRTMTKGLIEHVRRWANAFPSSAGITGNYSPSNIIDGSQNPDCNRKRIVYGAYAQVYTGTSNDIQSRTWACRIRLRCVECLPEVVCYH